MGEWEAEAAYRRLDAAELLFGEELGRIRAAASGHVSEAWASRIQGEFKEHTGAVRSIVTEAGVKLVHCADLLAFERKRFEDGVRELQRMVAEEVARADTATRQARDLRAALGEALRRPWWQVARDQIADAVGVRLLEVLR